MAGIKNRSKAGKRYHVVRQQRAGSRVERWFPCTAKTPECKRCNGRLAAQRYATELEQQRDTPRATTSQRLTIEELFELWMDTHVRPNRSENTERFYLSQRARIMLMGHRYVDDLTPLDIADWMNVLQADGCPAARVNRTLRTLKAMLRKGVEWGVTDNHPARFTAKLPEEPGKPARRLSPVEVSALVAATPLLRDATLIQVAAYSGLRMSELLGLEWKHVDLDAGTVTARQQLSHKSREIRPTKSYSHREVPMLAPARDALAQWRRQAPDSTYVFPDEDGLPLTQSKWGKRFQRIRRDAGVSATFNELRDTFATTMIDAGANVRQIKAWMAHSTINTTFKHYAERFEGGDANVVAAADKIVDTKRRKGA